MNISEKIDCTICFPCFAIQKGFFLTRAKKDAIYVCFLIRFLFCMVPLAVLLDYIYNFFLILYNIYFIYLYNNLNLPMVPGTILKFNA